MVDLDYASYKIGKQKAEDIIRLTRKVSNSKDCIRTNFYKETLKTLLSYYIFECDGEDEYIEADLLLEKNLILHDLELSKDMVIAFVRAGIVVIQHYQKIKIIEEIEDTEYE